jgi:hypothetical protein
MLNHYFKIMKNTAEIKGEIEVVDATIIVNTIDDINNNISHNYFLQLNLLVNCTIDGVAIAFTERVKRPLPIEVWERLR